MGVVASKVSRKLRRFNAENRAHRVLERDKPVPAPKFESNLEDMRRTIEVDPDIVETLNRKDGGLDARLKSVYVTSQDSFIDYAAMKREAEEVGRPLPLDRETPAYFEFGHLEPERATPGHCTLRQAMQFLADHYEQPDLWGSQQIADQYKLKHEIVEHILHHFKPFSVYIPDKKLNESILTQVRSKLLESKTAAKKDDDTSP